MKKFHELYIALNMTENIALPEAYIKRFRFGRLAFRYPRVKRFFMAFYRWLDTMNGTRIIIMR